MTTLPSVISYLDALLSPAKFADNALNGLQLESEASTIRTIAFAVDSGMSICEQAVAAEAQLLVVHHGMMWGTEHPITGPFGKKLAFLLKNRCSLYGSHLPLDAHLEVGNNVELARYFDLEGFEPAFEHRGVLIGVKARAPRPRPLKSFVECATKLRNGVEPLVLAFGKSEISSVGIVTGSGCSGIPQAAAAGCDLFITGEPKQDAYHTAKELRINLICAGHYATETFGVRALEKRLKAAFDVNTVFIEEDTGI